MATKALSAVFLRRLLGLSPCGRYATAKQWKVKIQPGAFFPASVCPCSFYCTSGVFYRNEVDVSYRNGLPVISVPLPSRRENCEFTLKPITHTVGDFIQFLKDEDGGIDRSSVYTKDGLKIAKSTTMDILLQNDFRLIINDQEYNVVPPDTKILVHEDAEQLSDVKNLIATLYGSLNIDQHQLQQERDLQASLEHLRHSLAPYEKIKIELAEQAKKRMMGLSWLGLGLMGCQFGVLARLTWWEYSWDIMEPVTYFITYGTSIAMFAYFVLTKQEYNFAEVKERAYILSFYKAAKKQKLDVERYNELKNQILITELDLQRLRDPLELHLPLPPHKTKPQTH